jgi:hypothetical protein
LENNETQTLKTRRSLRLGNTADLGLAEREVAVAVFDDGSVQKREKRE